MSQKLNLGSPEIDTNDDDDATEIDTWEQHYEEITGLSPSDALDDGELLLFSALPANLIEPEIAQAQIETPAHEGITEEIPCVSETVTTEASTAEFPIVTREQTIMMIKQRAKRHVAQLLTNKYQRRTSYGHQARTPTHDATRGHSRILDR